MVEIIKFYSVKGHFGFMSNFACYQIMIGGKTYPSNEHYYQSQKFSLWVFSVKNLKLKGFI